MDSAFGFLADATGLSAELNFIARHVLDAWEERTRRLKSTDHDIPEPLAPPRQIIRHGDGTLTDADTDEVLDLANDNQRADDDELPNHLTRPPRLLGDVVDWIVDTARSPSRVLALGSALS